MTLSSEKRTVKRWACSACQEAGISISLGDCPNCKHSRCMDCDVKSHLLSHAEIEEENTKVARAVFKSNSQNQPARSREAEGSSSSTLTAYLERGRESYDAEPSR